MLKSISQLVSESQDPIIKDLTSLKPTYICDDCMHGQHEVIGNSTCQCACHNNPACFVCGECLILPFEIQSSGCHAKCEDLYNEQEATRVANEPFGRYPWER